MCRPKYRPKGISAASREARSGLVGSWLASRDNLIEEVRASKRATSIQLSVSLHREQALTMWVF